MEALSEQEYKLITLRHFDYKSPIYGLVKDERAFVGELDFNNSNVISYINSLILTDNYGYKIYSGFNYENSDVTLKDGKLQWYETFDNIKIIKYKHCRIGKPKYVIIYQTMIK